MKWTNGWKSTKKKKKKKNSKKEKTCKKSLVSAHLIAFKGYYYKWDQKSIFMTLVRVLKSAALKHALEIPLNVSERERESQP